jgi:hypothetical protein
MDGKARRKLSLQKKIALLVGIAAMILCYASVLAQESRPDTGTFIKESIMDGRGELDIINNGIDDAVAALKENKTGILVGAVYIRGGDVFKMTGIEDGSYDLYFKQGQSWNASLQSFEANASQSRMDDPLTFETVRVPEGIRYSMVEVTLNKSREEIRSLFLWMTRNSRI